MRVVKRNGEYENVSFDKVLNRIKLLSDELDVDIYDIGQKVCSRIFDLVKTSELDELAAHICSSMIVDNPDYGVLASRLIVSNHHKNTSPSFSETIIILYNNDVHGEKSPLVNDKLYDIVVKNKEKLNSYINYERDYSFDYFGFKTLERSYLIKIDNKAIERPQHMFMRVSLGIHSDDLREALQTYDYMSRKYFTHATPTLFNSGTITPQMSSCFVAGTKVYTLNGTKSIEDVEIGDMVITHMGRPKKVVQKHVNPIAERQLYDFKVFNTPVITATENHEFMSITTEQGEWDIKPKWNRLDSLRIGDYIEIPQYTGSNNSPIINCKDVLENIKGDGNNIKFKYEFDEEKNEIRPYSQWSCIRNTKKSGEIVVDFEKANVPIKMIWNIDETFCKMLGVWYGDGHVIQDRNTARELVPKGIGFTLHKDNKNLEDFLVETCEHFFGIKASVHYAKKQNVTQVLFHSQSLGYVFKELFGKYFDNKKVYTDIHTWDNKYIESLISGLITSDGFVTQTGQVRIGMCNPKFVRDIYNLSRSRGFVVSYVETYKNYVNKEGESRKYLISYMSVPNQHCYMKSINKTYTDGRIETYQDKISTSSNTKNIDGRTFLRINYKKPSEKVDKIVYTLGVEDDHSYMVDGIIAKNCFLIGMNSDSIDGIFDTVKECARISKHAGGIGLHIHNIRCKGSRIRSTNGVSDGLVPMLKVFNHVGRYINQCFVPDTFVFTDKGVSKMKDVVVGTNLMTFDIEKQASVFKPVLSVAVSHIDTELLQIKTAIGTDVVKVTKQHELYVRRSSDEEPAYIPASELQVGNYMGYPEKDGMFWFKIDNVSTVDYEGEVYDFNMEDNHNYTVANLGLVHNSGKRNGSIAMYLEPWHADIEAFLDLKKPHGNEDDRARDLFYALWVSDLFMKRVKTGEMWSLMCPDQCKGLSDVYGDEFVELYEGYEKSGLYIKQIPAQELWFKIMESQIESGVPYILYKDAANKKSNQKNLGTIKSSNLCCEIMQYSSPEETSVCNLSSLCLPTFIVKQDDGTCRFDFEKLHEIVGIATKNLNKIIDINFYPIEKAKTSNLRHRPIGIGIQGLADTFIIMRYAFDSDEAHQLNKDIFETIYHGAVEASMLIAKKRHELIEKMRDENTEDTANYLNLNKYENISAKYPGAYSSFEGSPASKGVLQFDMWGVTPNRYDWDALKAEILKYGMRNSLLVAPMPTASTSQIMGFTESFECITSNIYKRKTLAGEFVLVNKYLINDLIKEGLWDKDMRNKIMMGEGSIQNILEIPENLRKLYKTVWEISQKVIIDQAAQRGPFICQSQSMNLFMEDPDFKKLSSMHFYAWTSGLKTGSYYIRSKPKARVQQFTIEPKNLKTVICTDEVCTVCSS